MVFKFKNTGISLGTRFLGEKIRKEIEAAFLSESLIIFDFEDVTVVSHSFADECFGKLLLQFDLNILKSKTTFKNTSNEIKRTIAFTLREREKQFSC